MTGRSPDGRPPARPAKIVGAVLAVVAVVVAAVLVVFLRDDADTPTAAAPTATAQPMPAPGPASPSAATGGQLWPNSCENPLGFTIAYPEGWDANEEPLPEPCVWFSPDLVEAPPEATDALIAPITVRVQEGVDLARATDPDPTTETVTDRRETTVDGHRAVRIEATFVGGGAFAEDPRTAYWVVELPPGPDGTPRALVAQAFPWQGLPLGAGATVLDGMMGTLRFTG